MEAGIADHVWDLAELIALKTSTTFRDVMVTIRNVFVFVVMIAIYLYLVWKRGENRYRGLGDGGIQKLFEKQGHGQLPR